MLRILPYLLSLALAFSLRADEPIRFILDTDLASDCDDAGALAMVNTMTIAGKVDFLAVMISTGGNYSAPAACAINTWYGHGGIPVGTLKNPGFWSGGGANQPSGAANFESYTRTLAETCPTRLKYGADAPDARALYRKVLSGQPDHSVVITSIGPLINLAGLLDTPPDDLSPLSGIDLIRAKVKMLVVAGGKNPIGTSSNFSKAGAGPFCKAVIDRWPTSIVFVGNEIGAAIKTGWTRNAAANEGNPAALAYKLFFKGDATKERSSADQAGILFAICGLDGIFSRVEGGHMESTESGKTTWVPTPKEGQTHSYLSKLPGADPKIKDHIETWMTQGSPVSH